MTKTKKKKIKVTEIRDVIFFRKCLDVSKNAVFIGWVGIYRKENQELLKEYLPHLREISTITNAKTENIQKKYELTDETIEHDGRTLYRIIALRDFGNIKKGDLGGYVESEENLSHEGNCWVGEDAMVYNDARICGDDFITWGDENDV